MSLNPTDLRQTLLRLRAQQDPADCRRGALLMRGRLFTWLNSYKKQWPHPDRPIHIAAFWALAQEPELQPLLQQWADDSQLRLSLPCMVAENAPLVFKPWQPSTPMKSALFGVQEPDTLEIAPHPDIILVPTLGFSRQGDRLGYGKGYYDRTLAQLQAQSHPFISIGIAWAVGDLSSYSYHPQAHDVPLDAVLTDKGWAVPAPTFTG